MSEIHSNNPDLQLSIEKENTLELRLDNIEKSYSRFWIGFSEFSDYILWLEKSQREDILWVFEDVTNKKSIIKYLKKDWNPFPTYETISFFKQEFLEDSSLIINEKENQENLKDINLLVSKFLNLKTILSSYDDNEIKDFLSEIDITEDSSSEDKNLFLNEINDYLTLNPDKVSYIAKYLIEKDWVDSENYKEFKSTLSSISPSFEQVFQEIEKRQENIKSNTSWEITDLEKIYISSSLYNWIPERQWDFLVSGDIKMDLWEVPPVRYLQLEWSEYSIKTPASIWDFSDSVINYERKINEIKPKVEENNKIVNWFEGSINNINSLDFSSTSDLQTAFGEIDKLSLFPDKNDFKLKIEQLSDKNPIEKSEADKLKTDIISALNSALFPYIESKKILEKEVSEIKTEYQKNLNQAKTEYIRKLKEKDEKTRKTLKFLQDIGFDMIPKSITDRVIDHINSSTIKWKLWFDAPIDLENWKLWINIDTNLSENSPLEKAQFAKIVNVMISWKDTEPIETFNIGTNNKAIWNEFSFIWKLNESGVNDSTTWFWKIIQRLNDYNPNEESKEESNK